MTFQHFDENWVFPNFSDQGIFQKGAIHQSDSVSVVNENYINVLHVLVIDLNMFFVGFMCVVYTLVFACMNTMII